MATQRIHLEIKGRTQGVGYRPFVYRLVSALGLGGWVRNDERGVTLEIEGEGEIVALARQRLFAEHPEAAVVHEVQSQDIPIQGQSGFEIVYSEKSGQARVEITPDMATCARCLEEMRDPNNRRYRYPFINCTDCGPRYSMIQGMPYDREQTTMSAFSMCEDCQEEYEDPASRRFHAEPNACEVCGPQLEWESASGDVLRAEEALQAAVAAILDQQVIGVKGIGGYHMVCLANSEKALSQLRKSKSRNQKPFALMVGNGEALEGIVNLDARSRVLLESRAAPILLLPRSTGATQGSSVNETVHALVAPGLDQLGVMLAYTPLHHLLCDALKVPLVVTSANFSGDPLCFDREEARVWLEAEVQGLVSHDRKIERRLDDSVVIPAFFRDQVTGESIAGDFPVRRARGYAPASLSVSLGQGEKAMVVLGMGAMLKTTLCFLDLDHSGRGRAILSEHLGDLSSAATYRHYLKVRRELGSLLELEPEVLACDLHPDLPSTHEAKRIGRERGIPVVPVQHHHAHVLSCMADNHVSVAGEDAGDRVLGLVCDGVGYGEDGTSWGGELMWADEWGYERVGSLSPFALPGGDRGAKECWRPALGWVMQVLDEPGMEWSEAERAWLWSRFYCVDPMALQLARQRVEAGREPMTSALGRLFDAVAFLLGVVKENSYEAESGMRLEAMARAEIHRNTKKAHTGPDYAFIINHAGDDRDQTKLLRLSLAPFLKEMCQVEDEGRSCKKKAAAFHEAIIKGFVMMICELDPGEEATVALTGGCFANRILLEGMHAGLQEQGYLTKQILTHRRVPPGDGGLALGQAIAAAAQMNRT